MSSSVLSVEGLSKRYGRIKAVNQLNLNIPKGAVYGILGPNGSGKSTTLGMLLNVVNPTSGNFKWFGRNSLEDQLTRIGAILEQPNFYPYLSGEKNLEIVAELKKVEKSRIDEVLKQVGLFDRKTDHFKHYSLGMKQRLSIGSALLNNPDVLVLDEPTNGLDPAGIVEIRDLIRGISESGKTILLASHLLDEVEKVCSHVAVLKSGTLLFAGEVSKLVGNSQAKYKVHCSEVVDLHRELIGCPWITEVVKSEDYPEQFIVELEGERNGTDLNKYLFEQKIVLDELTCVNANLEEGFLKLIRG